MKKIFLFDAVGATTLVQQSFAQHIPSPKPPNYLLFTDALENFLIDIVKMIKRFFICRHRRNQLNYRKKQR